MEGRIHSVQSLGAVDGPGLRYVVFMQGCPLRCAYCHNPDTWEFGGGEAVTAEQLVQKALRCRPYFKNGGGVTVTGGEPLAQADFVADLFEKLHREGVHTALDTSGAGSPEAAKRVLEHTDLVLLDIKFATEEGYRAHCGGSLQKTLEFLGLVQERGVPFWVRHVVAPGLTDSDESLREIHRIAHSFTGLQKIEWLPYKNMCLEKYQRLGIKFPMGDAPALDAPELEKRLRRLGIWE